MGRELQSLRFYCRWLRTVMTARKKIDVGKSGEGEKDLE
jgi:hypothetical protein